MVKLTKDERRIRQLESKILAIETIEDLQKLQDEVIEYRTIRIEQGQRELIAEALAQVSKNEKL